MPLVPADANHAAQMKALIEQRNRLPLRAFVGLFFTDQNINLLSQ
jgi:hypothetical protein